MTNYILWYVIFPHPKSKFNCDVIILSIYEGFNQIAYYSVSVKLALIIALALMSVNIVIAPKVAEVFEKGHFNEMQILIKILVKLKLILNIWNILLIIR